MTWELLFLSLGLVLVIEGILPFASPEWFRSRMAEMSKLPDGQLRIIGGACMAAGLVLMWLV